jgi:hypothetical protein
MHAIAVMHVLQCMRSWCPELIKKFGAVTTRKRARGKKSEVSAYSQQYIHVYCIVFTAIDCALLLVSGRKLSSTAP